MLLNNNPSQNSGIKIHFDDVQYEQPIKYLFHDPNYDTNTRLNLSVIKVIPTSTNIRYF